MLAVSPNHAGAKLLFSQDIFGMHLAGYQRFDDEYAPALLEEAMEIKYAGVELSDRERQSAEEEVRSELASAVLIEVAGVDLDERFSVEYNPQPWFLFFWLTWFACTLHVAIVGLPASGRKPSTSAPESHYFFFFVAGAFFAFGSEYCVSTEELSAAIESLHCCAKVHLSPKLKHFWNASTVPGAAVILPSSPILALAIKDTPY